MWKLWFNIKCFFSHIHHKLFIKLEKYESDKIIELLKNNKLNGF